MIILSNDYKSNFTDKKVSSGGPARFASEFADFVRKKKYIWRGISLCTSPEPKLKVREITHRLSNFWLVNIDQQLIKSVCNAKHKLSPEKKLRPVINEVRKIIVKSQADIVFLNGFSIFNWIILKAAFEENKKIVIQHAGIFTKEINLYADFFSPWGRKILLQMEKDITDMAATEIFLNEYSRDVYFKLVRKVPAKKSVVIPLPFSGRKNKHPKFKKFDSSKQLKIGVIARWDRIKNHEGILKLAKAIRKQNLPWKIYSITKIPDTKAKLEFKNQYRDLIEVVAPMEYKHIIKFLQKMDLMILPSLFDVSPTVVIEAANEGLLTLISPNVGWVNEYRRSQCGSLIVDFNKPLLIINKIKKFDAPHLAPKINRMFLNLNKKHDKDIIFSEYIKLFKNLIVKN